MRDLEFRLKYFTHSHCIVFFKAQNSDLFQSQKPFHKKSSLLYSKVNNIDKSVAAAALAREARCHSRLYLFYLNLKFLGLFAH